MLYSFITFDAHICFMCVCFTASCLMMKRIARFLENATIQMAMVITIKVMYISYISLFGIRIFINYIHICEMYSQIYLNQQKAKVESEFIIRVL